MHGFVTKRRRASEARPTLGSSAGSAWQAPEPMPRAHSTPAAASPSDCQPYLAIKSLGLLPVDQDPLSAQQDMQTAIAEPATLVGQLAQLLMQTGVIVLRKNVTHALAIGIEDKVRLLFAQPMMGLEMSDSFPLRSGRQNLFARVSFGFPSAPPDPALHRPAAA